MIIEKEYLLDETNLFYKVKGASLVLRAISNNIRQLILKLLEQNTRLIVTEIMVHLRQEQSITSQHLAILRRSNIVTTKREGKKIFYALNESRLQQINRFTELLLSA